MTRISAFTALQDAFGKEQAQALAEYMETQVAPVDLSGLATKNDVLALKDDFATLKNDVSSLRDDFHALKDDVRSLKTEQVRFSTKDEIRGLRDDIQSLKTEQARFASKDELKDLEIRLLKEIQKSREDLSTRIQWTAFVQILTTIAALIGLSKLI